jgi:hypothetical protein
MSTLTPMEREALDITLEDDYPNIRRVCPCGQKHVFSLGACSVFKKYVADVTEKVKAFFEQKGITTFHDLPV